MTRPGKIALVAGLTLLGLAALLLHQVQRLQKLGQPGVKLIAQPMLDDAGVLRGDHVVDLPVQVLDWKSVALPISTQVVKWLPSDTVYGQRIYSAPDGWQLQMNVVLMGTDRTSIHKPEYCLPSQGVTIESRETRSITVRSPHEYTLPVTLFRLKRETQQADGRKSEERMLYVFWFVADDQLTPDHNERMRWMARDLITRLTLQRWAYVSCLVGTVPGQEEAAFTRMAEFLAEAVPKFQLATGAPARVAQGTP